MNIFGPLSTLQRTAVPITHLPPSPSNPAPNLYTTISCPSPLSHSLFSSLLPRLTLTACCAPCLGASLRWMPTLCAEGTAGFHYCYCLCLRKWHQAIFRQAFCDMLIKDVGHLPSLLSPQIFDHPNWYLLS